MLHWFPPFLAGLGRLSFLLPDTPVCALPEAILYALVLVRRSRANLTLTTSLPFLAFAGDPLRQTFS